MEPPKTVIVKEMNEKDSARTKMMMLVSLMIVSSLPIQDDSLPFNMIYFRTPLKMEISSRFPAPI